MNRNILIADLLPPDPSTTSGTILLQPALAKRILAGLNGPTLPRLLVRNGQFSLKFGDQIVPCSMALESSPVHIYRGHQSTLSQQFACQGQVLGKLSTAAYSKARSNSDKLDGLAQPARPPASAGTAASTRSSDTPAHPDYSLLKVEYAPYRLEPHDSPAQATSKLIHLLALGPISKHTIMDLMSPPSELRRIVEDCFSTSTMVYDPKDTFTSDDHFPVLECQGKALNIDSYAESPHYILKDKLYKDLQPWKWQYQEFERILIIQNTHHALTRLGYSQTHPLRRKLCERPTDAVASQTTLQDQKLTPLGGGFLASKRAPTRKSAVSATPPVSAPASTTPKRSNPPLVSKQVKRSVSSLSLAQPQFHGQGHKRTRLDTVSTPDVPHSHAPSSSADQSPTRRSDYYATLATKFANRYLEYEALYRSFPARPPSTAAAADYKRELTKLYELHNTLSQWKKILWDHDRERKQKPQIMTLSKHKKTPVSRPQSPALPFTSSLAPSKSASAIPEKEPHPVHPALAPRPFVKKNLDY